MSRSITSLFLLASFAFDPLAWAQSSAPHDSPNRHSPNPSVDNRASAGRAKPADPSSGTNFDADPLIRVLVTKGVLTTDEDRCISDGKPSEQRDRLAQLLRDKGLISAADLEALRADSHVADPVALTVTTQPASPPGAVIAKSPDPSS